MSENNQKFQTEFTVQNKAGLHARPGATLANLAKKFESDITITNLSTKDKPTNAKNLVNILACGIKYKDKILLTVTGKDAEEAFTTISTAINEGLGE